MRRDAVSRAREKRSLLWSLGISVVMMVGEVVGGLLTNSLALLTDAGHMFTDSSSVLLSFVALSLATRPIDRQRTYGFYRLEILAAFLNALLLVGLALTVFWHAYGRFREPPVVDALPMLGWAAAGLLANLVSVWLLSRSRDSLNSRSAFLHVLFDTISSVFVVAGGIVMYYTGWFWLDPLLSCLLGVLILVAGVRLLWEAGHILIEGVPREIDIEDVRRSIGETPGVCAVRDLHVWSITSGLCALSAHLVVDADSLGRNDAILCAVNERLRLRFRIEHTTLQIQSDGYEHVGGTCEGRACEGQQAVAAAG